VAAFASTFALVFVTELGDKSMLLALTFGSRYRAWLVIAAVAVAGALVMAIAVLAGGAADAVLPTSWIAAIAGLLFIGFGVWTWFNVDDDEEISSDSLLGDGAWLTVLALAGAFVVAEFGDKTQLAVISISGLSPASRFGVWAGGTVGFVLVDSLAVLLGDRLRRITSAGLIERASAVAFILFGLIALLVAIDP
jgi:putative Ca2+/H+ antiporter (TMEM165/GDT1 family)